jgi:hypothetical protein
MKTHEDKQVGSVCAFDIGDHIVDAGVADVASAGSQRFAKKQRAKRVGGFNAKPVAGENSALDPGMHRQVVCSAKLQEFDGLGKVHSEVFRSAPITAGGKVEPMDAVNLTSCGVPH